MIRLGSEIDDTDGGPQNLRRVVGQPFKPDLELRGVDNAAKGAPESGDLGQAMRRGQMSEWLIERELGANGSVVQNASNMNGEGNDSIGDLLLHMALDDGSVGERKWGAPERPRPCGRCFGLLQHELVDISYRVSCTV